MEPTPYACCVLAALVGYLFGCFNPAKILSMIKRTDITKSGTGNLGASNAAIHFGPAAGFAVAVLDAAKAAVPAVLMKTLLPTIPLAPAIAATCAVAGHCMPFWNRFAGGKGFAAYIGLMIVLDWKTGTVVLLSALFSAYRADKIVYATFICVTAYPIVQAAIGTSWQEVIIIILASLLIVYKHRSNIKALHDGTEPGIRASIKKPRNQSQSKKGGDDPT